MSNDAEKPGPTAPTASVLPLSTFADRSGRFNSPKLAPPAPKPEVLWPEEPVTHIIIAGMGQMFVFGTQESLQALATGEPETWITVTCVAKEGSREPLRLRIEDMRFLLKTRTHAEWWASWWKDEVDAAQGTPPRAS